MNLISAARATAITNGLDEVELTSEINSAIKAAAMLGQTEAVFRVSKNFAYDPQLATLADESHARACVKWALFELRKIGFEAFTDDYAGGRFYLVIQW